MGPKPEPEYVTATWDGGPPRLLISTLADCRYFIHACPSAQTLEAYSLTYQCTVWIPLSCKRWSCHFCANLKVKALARKTQAARPNRLMTLTVNPSLHDNPRAAFDATRRKVSELIKLVRAKFGDCEYLRVTELTRGGWPHYHLLVRSPYLPHAWIKAEWEKLTGAIIVDVRQVKDHFNTFNYLVKYLTKMHDIGWTDRHCSYSRNFFPPADEKRPDDLQLSETRILETHPADLVYHQFRKSELVEIQYNVFALNPAQSIIDQVTAAGNETFTLVKPGAK